MAPAPTPTPAPEGATPPTPPAQPTPPEPPAQPPPPAPATGDESLGEGGLRALQAERAARAAADAKTKTLEAQLAELQAAQMTDQEKALADAKSAGRAEATTEVRGLLFSAEAKVAAAGKLQDPTLFDDPDVALKLLGLAEVPVTTDGKIDSAAVTAAIDLLATQRPYLAATGTTPPNPGSADGGARGTGQPPTLADQIASAEAKGDWTTAGQLKAQQLMGLHTTT